MKLKPYSKQSDILDGLITLRRYNRGSKKDFRALKKSYRRSSKLEGIAEGILEWISLRLTKTEES